MIGWGLPRPELQRKEIAMSRYMKCVAMWSGLILWVAAAGCANCPLCKKLAGEPQPVIVEEPPAPADVAPPPPPSPPPPGNAPPPAPRARPPAVAKAIEDLSDKYPGLFRMDKDKGLLHFNSDLLFDSGSAVVKSEAKTALGKLAEILSTDEVRDRRLTLIGHTDSDRVVKRATIAALKTLGKSADNMGLSEARAEAVAAVLQDAGIDAARMTTIGRGATEPVADNKSPGGKAKNRRVDIFLTPIK